MADAASSAVPSSLAPFQEPMRTLVGRVRNVDIRAFEVSSTDRIAVELRPAALACLDEAQALLTGILEECDRLIKGAQRPQRAASGLSFDLAMDVTVAAMFGSHREVAQIAFIADLELRKRRERLELAEEKSGAVQLLSECDSSLRQVCKAMSAVDAAIARAESIPAKLDFTFELETSLLIRRTYALLRARILALGEPTPETLRAQFRSAGTLLAMFVGWEAYAKLRVSDRLLIRDLQGRILEWLRRGPDASIPAGLRLWQDLVACVEIFSLVNLRQELIEHDTSSVHELRALIQAESGTEVRPAIRRILDRLNGFDQELDQLLASNAVTIAALRPMIERLAGRLELSE